MKGAPMDRHVLDSAAVAAPFVALVNWIPPLVAFLACLASLVYTVIRIYESKTVQKMLGRT